MMDWIYKNEIKKGNGENTYPVKSKKTMKNIGLTKKSKTFEDLGKIMKEYYH